MRVDRIVLPRIVQKIAHVVNSTNVPVGNVCVVAIPAIFKRTTVAIIVAALEGALDFTHSTYDSVYTCCDSSVSCCARAAVGGAAAAGNVTTMGERPGSMGGPGGMGDMPNI